MLVRRGAGPNRLLKDGEDSQGKLRAFAQALCDAGGEASCEFVDGTDPEQVAALVQRVEQDVGPIHFINYNIGAQVLGRPHCAPHARRSGARLRCTLAAPLSVFVGACRWATARSRRRPTEFSS